jgi:hypothetical protein
MKKYGQLKYIIYTLTITGTNPKQYMDVILHSKYVEQATDGDTILKYIPYINLKALKSSTWQPAQKV